ncbi:MULTISPECIES: cell division protein FtsA [Pseudovibrio]|uniref:cell division protein FtsA n=1 Tax=Stappiaceae TaxID=2821832 RepID=UPI0023671E48|nr:MULTISPECIES: cell division protein FtsA [Pseudovibrio]MDD7910325.1 cell division protein FtsA [Pseudovibrio exalbescens]MDX5594040.1 cell division protein FtsA [Pseudovibrio sp. SPO723]
MSTSKKVIYLPRKRPLPSRRAAVVSVLDVGSSKICCLIAKLTPNEDGELLPGRTHSIELLGYGHQRSRGIKSGVVVDLDQAEQAIRKAVDSAERMAGVMVESLLATVTCGRLQSEIFSASVPLSSESVSESDIQRVLTAGSTHTATDGRAVMHALPISYGLDGNRGIRDPRGMMGRKLGVDMQVVTAEVPPVRNLELCINRGHLHVENLVATPYASGLSTLVGDETELGVACIDMGGGTTTISIFVDGQMVHLDAIAVGGNHVTMDIARALSTRMQDAERIKTLHGSALPSAVDDRDFISVPPVDQEGDLPTQIPRAMLTRVIRPRVEEILELIQERLVASGFAGRVGKRVVLTGGASQLTGLSETARRILGRNVRLGRPLGIANMPDVAKGPAFSAACGLLVYPQVAQIEQFEPRAQRGKWLGTGNYFARVGQWIRESF